MLNFFGARWVLVAGVLLFGAGNGEGATTGTSFKDLWRLALSKNSDFQNATRDYDYGTEVATDGKWRLAPEIGISSSRRYELRPEKVTDGTQTNATATWVLYDGLKDLRAATSTDVYRQGASGKYRAAKLDLLESLGTSYLGWQKAHRQEQLLEQLVGRRTQALETVKAMARRGERAMTEPLLFENQLLEAQERLTGAKITRQDFERRVTEVIAESRNLDGEDPDVSLVFSESYCNASSDFNQHPEVTWRQAEMELSDNAVANARWEFGPTVQLRADRSIDFASSPSERDTSAAVLSMDWPIFTGLSSRAEVRTAVLQKQKAEQGKLDELRRLKLDHKRNCAAFTSINRRVDLLKRINSNYESLLTRAKSRYRRGEISGLDLIDQELRLFNSQLDLLTSEFEKQSLMLSQALIHNAPPE